MGIDISPPLIIENAPENTKSFALIMKDPDVPLNIRSDGLWIHWLLYNIPLDKTFLDEGNKIGTLGKGTSGESSYMGPCPPDRKHRYFFYLYALDKKTSLDEGLQEQELLLAIKEYVICKTELMGLYEKN